MHLPTDQPYDIGELGRLTGLSVRTIRYYIQQKLVPPSPGMGPGARYDEGHLIRLRLIRHFQRQRFSLAEIAEKFHAADLVGESTTVLAALQESLAASDANSVPQVNESSSAISESGALLAQRSQWERIVMSQELELHVRRPLSRADHRNLERLLEAARAIFGQAGAWPAAAPARSAV